MEILSVGAELFHTDGRTDKTKLTVTFRNFVNAPKNLLYHRRSTFQASFKPTILAFELPLPTALSNISQ